MDLEEEVGRGSLASEAGVVGSRCGLHGRPGFEHDVSRRMRNFDCRCSGIRRWWSATETRQRAVYQVAKVARLGDAASAVDAPAVVAVDVIGGGVVVRTVDDASPGRICDSVEPAAALHIVDDRTGAVVLVLFSRSSPLVMRLGRWGRSIGIC